MVALPRPNSLISSVLVILLLSAGCNRPRGPAPAPAVAPAAATDYRTLTAAELRVMIQSKTGSEVTELNETGPNRYTGTIVAPGGDRLPLAVTVEEQRIVCETKTPAGSLRQVITPQGIDAGRPDLR
jgi:hypothetical protein